jgi:hypothetical protein
MTSMLRHVDRWLFVQYRASAHDLAVARVVLAAFLLLLLPRGRWIADLPQAFYSPPPAWLCSLTTSRLRRS